MPWEALSFLLNRYFTLESDYLEKRFDIWMSTLKLKVSGALATARENPRECFYFALVRTHNRIRSPR